jgi:hypothetical protein
VGTAWFWFQGAVNTTIFPLYVSQSAGVNESFVTLLFISATSGAVLGSFVCRMLAKRLLYAHALPVLVLLAIVIPSVDITLLGQSGSGTSPIRVLANIFILSAATGFYLVPLMAAIQAFSPETKRARYIGIGNTLSGFAIIMAGVVIAGAGGIELKPNQQGKLDRPLRRSCRNPQSANPAEPRPNALSFARPTSPIGTASRLSSPAQILPEPEKLIPSSRRFADAIPFRGVLH